MAKKSRTKVAATQYTGIIHAADRTFEVDGIMTEVDEQPPVEPDPPVPPPAQNDYDVLVIQDAKGGLRLDLTKYANYEIHVAGNMNLETPIPAKGRHGSIIFINPAGFKVSLDFCWMPAQVGNVLQIGKGVWLLVYYNAYDSDNPRLLCNAYESLRMDDD